MVAAFAIRASPPTAGAEPVETQPFATWHNKVVLPPFEVSTGSAPSVGRHALIANADTTASATATLFM
ncbi:hypothetical protein K7G98_42845, partial [Saccharothrix sp. MB29]|nr:hypothetical protein [Saccharothrix sp. MB29]